MVLSGYQANEIPCSFKNSFRLLGFLLIVFILSDSSESWIVLASYTLSSALICLFLNIKLINKIGFIKLDNPISSIKLIKKSIPSFIISISPLLLSKYNIDSSNARCKSYSIRTLLWCEQNL